MLIQTRADKPRLKSVCSQNPSKQHHCSQMGFFIPVVAILVIIVLLYLLHAKQTRYFSEHGVPYMSFFPIIGNMWDFIFFRRHFKDWAIESYNQFANKKFYGVYQFTNPFIFVRDLDLIKQITVKEFDSFHDHVILIDEHADRLFGNGLFTLRGQKWKDMRATLSPAFTSSKMKQLYRFIVECAENAVNHLTEEMKKKENKENGYASMEMKDLSTRFTNDSIASAVYGLEVNSMNDENNYFYKMGKEITTFSALMTLKMLGFAIIPNVLKFFKISIFGKEPTAFFFNLVEKTMENREKENIVRPDMIQLLMEAKKGTLKHDQSLDDKDAGFATVEESTIGKANTKREWSQDELAAQAVLFFFAGFETTSTLLCFVAYELARNPDIQKRLQEEIDEVASKQDGKLVYQDLHHMKYMDMVISETLRMWPPAIATDRRCNKPFTLPPVDENTKLQFTVEAGKAIQIPIFAIHYDPEYYPDPEKFDPERFSDENKGNINPYSYLPFGIGPRNCIGSRFALMETKALIFYLLLKFDIIVTPKTEIPIQLKTTTFNLHAKNGFWVGFKPRKLKDT